MILDVFRDVEPEPVDVQVLLMCKSKWRCTPLRRVLAETKFLMNKEEYDSDSFSVLEDYLVGLFGDDVMERLDATLCRV